MKQAFNDFGALLEIIGSFLVLLVGLSIPILLIGTGFGFLGIIFVEINVFESQDYFDMEDGKIIYSVFTCIKLFLCGIVVVIIPFLKIAYWAVWGFGVFLIIRYTLKHFGFRYYISHPNPEDCKNDTPQNVNLADVEGSSKED